MDGRKKRDGERYEEKARRKKNKRWQKWLGAILIFMMAALFFIANLLVDVALIPSKMKETEVFEKVSDDSVEALIKTDDITQNRQNAAKETKQWLETAETKKIGIHSGDGYGLIARVFLQEDTKHKWVLLLHGYTGEKEEMYPLACQYARRGYQILVPDMRCQGESEGDFIGMGWTDRKDNLLWLDYILKQDPQAEIVLHGQSMGTACALMTAGENLPENVKAIVSDCAYTDVYSMFQKQIKEWFHLPAFPLLDAANLVLQLRGGYNIREASALNQVKKSRLPILFIHGREDKFVPMEMAYELYDAAKGEKELLIIDGAGHVQSQDKDPDKYYGTIFSFLERAA